MVTAIYDRSTLDLDDVKEHLRVSGAAEDTWLQRALDAAKRGADDYCNNELLDDAGDPLDPIPESIDQWILQRIDRLYNLRAEGATNVSVAMLGSVQWEPDDYVLLYPYWTPTGF